MPIPVAAGITLQVDSTTGKVNADPTGKVYANEKADGSAAACCCGCSTPCQFCPDAQPACTVIASIDIPVVTSCPGSPTPDGNYWYCSGSSVSGGRFTKTVCLTPISAGPVCSWHYVEQPAASLILHGFSDAACSIGIVHSGNPLLPRQPTTYSGRLEIILGVNSGAEADFYMVITQADAPNSAVEQYNPYQDFGVTYPGSPGTQYLCNATETWPSANGTYVGYSSASAISGGTITTTFANC